jgi:pyridoxal phosphate enzyme (YggS family)
VVELISGLRADVVRANLAEVREEIAEAATAAGRDPEDVEVLAATKYVSADNLPVLAQAGIELVGENRAQDLVAKVAAVRSLSGGGPFEWDFIGRLQSRKVKAIVPHVRLIHSVASESVLRELDRHQADARPALKILIEVNVAGEPGKDGVAPKDLDAFIELAPVPVAGLMTMPPFAENPEDSRRWFAALRSLADERGLKRLSMGTSQDYRVAVEEGATIVRIGTRLYDGG